MPHGKKKKAIESFRIDFDVDIYITGSNAYLLSTEFSTLLSGRYVEIRMLPLSFKEYISAFENKNELQEKLLSYIKFGGFPQTIELFNIATKSIKSNLFK